MSDLNIITEPARTMSTFDYALFRRCLDAANSDIVNKENIQTEVIVPYGFEVLTIYTDWKPIVPYRHYPTIGCKQCLSDDDKLNLGNLFQATLTKKLREYYPIFYAALVQNEIHGCGYFSKTNIHEQLADQHTIHIEVFELQSKQTILEHYSNYVATFFGLKTNPHFPELRDFYESKTRRNHLFQRYVASEAIVYTLLEEGINEPVELTPEQSLLSDELFAQLRIQNHSERMYAINPEVIAITQIEIDIMEKLIFPRIAALQACIQGTDNVELYSPAYYNGKNTIRAIMSKHIYEQITSLVKKTYHEFPQIAQRHQPLG